MRACHVARSSPGSSASGPELRASRRPRGACPRAARRPCPSCAGRGSAARRAPSSGGSQAAPRVQAARRLGCGRGLTRSEGEAPPPSTLKGLLPGAARPRRPVSMALTTMRRGPRGPGSGTCRAGATLASRWPSEARAAPPAVPRRTSGCDDAATPAAVVPTSAAVKASARMRRSGSSGTRAIVARPQRVIACAGPVEREYAGRAGPVPEESSRPAGHGRRTDAPAARARTRAVVILGATGAQPPRRPDR